MKLASDRDGLAFFDGERAFAALRFGMAGQVTDADGRRRWPALIVFVPDATAGRRRPMATASSSCPTCRRPTVRRCVDFVVRYRRQTQSFRAVLDTFKHNIVDVVLAHRRRRRHRRPGVRPLPPPPPPSDPPQIETVRYRETRSSSHSNYDRAAAGIGEPYSPRARGRCSSRRRSAPDLSTATTVTGMIANRKFSRALTSRR